MATISSLVVELSLMANNFNNQLRAAQGEMKEWEKSIAPTVKALNGIGTAATAVGGTLTATLTAPIVGFGVLAVKNFSEAAEAAALVENAIRSTGGTAGKTSTELKKLASDLQAISKFDDDQILRNVTTNLLTFTNIAGGTFDRAQKAILDISTVLNQDLKSSTIQVGKALNDPIAGLTALRRIGVSFTQDQRDIIKNFVAMGDIASAQGLILAELEKEFGGAAAAAAAAGMGPFTQLKNVLGDLSESFGEIILNALVPIVPYIKAVAEWFMSLSLPIKTAIVVVAGLLAVVGPVITAFGLLALGIAAAIPVITSVVATVSTVGAPFIAAGLAIMGVIAALTAVGLAVIAFIASNEELRATVTAGWEQIKTAALELWNQLVPIFTQIKDALVAVWAQVGPDVVAAVSAALKTLLSAVAGGLKLVAAAIQAFHGLMTGDFNKFSAGIQKIWSMLWEALKKVVLGWVNILKNTITGFTTSVTNAFAAMYEAVVGHSYVPDMMDGIRDAFGSLGSIMVDPTRRATSGVLSSFRNLFDTVMGFARDWKGTLKGMGMDILGGFDLKGILKGDFSSIKDSILGTLGIGGGGKAGGGLGGIFGGGGTAGGGTGGGLLASLGGIGGITGGVQMIASAFGKIGAGRRSANDIVGAQNAFVNQTLAGILSDSSLSATNKLKMVDNAWAEFQGTLDRHAAAGGKNALTANQAFATVSPTVSGIRQDLMAAGANDSETTGGGNTFHITVYASGNAEAIAQAMWDVVHRNLNGFTEETVRQVQIKQGAVTAV